MTASKGKKKDMVALPESPVIEATVATAELVPPVAEATVPEPTTEPVPQRPVLPGSDRVGMLNHLVERWSPLDHTARFELEYAAETGLEVKATLHYEQEVDGKWKNVRKSAIGMNVDDAAGNLAREMAKA